MMVRGGHTIEVYRYTGRNRHGEGIEALVGTIDHVVFQWGSHTPMDMGEEMTSMSTVIFCPRDAAIRLQARDRFKLNGENYAVVGDRSWDENHPITGSNLGYYMMQVEVVS